MSRFTVVHRHKRRRHGIARNMAAAGWLRRDICRTLGFKPARLDAILDGSTLWGADTQKLKAAWQDYERLVA